MIEQLHSKAPETPLSEIKQEFEVDLQKFVKKDHSKIVSKHFTNIDRYFKPKKGVEYKGKKLDNKRDMTDSVEEFEQENHQRIVNNEHDIHHSRDSIQTKRI